MKLLIRNYYYNILNETDTYYECICENKKFDPFIRKFVKYKKNAHIFPNGRTISNNSNETIKIIDLINE